MSTPLTASASLLASPLMKRPVRPGDAAWGNYQPEVSVTGADTSERTYTATVIDLALRIGFVRRHKELDSVGDTTRAAFSDGRIGAIEYRALTQATGRRHLEISHYGKMHAMRYGAPQRMTYDHAKARERRGDLISMGLMPRSIRTLLTPGEQAVAAIYAEDYLAKGGTDDAKGFIGVRAGACTRLALRAQHALWVAGAIKIKKRTRPGQRGFSTIVEIVDPTWLLWLENRRVQKARCNNVQKCERPVCEQVPTDRKKEATDEELQERGQAPPRSPPSAALESAA
jgi:hypothetical protein